MPNGRKISPPLPIGYSGYLEVESSDEVDNFIQLIKHMLRKNGKGFVTVYDGFLFKTGSSKKVRELLLNEKLINSIVSLPAGINRPYTSAKVSVLILTMERNDRFWFKARGEDIGLFLIGSN